MTYIRKQYHTLQERILEPRRYMQILAEPRWVGSIPSQTGIHSRYKRCFAGILLKLRHGSSTSSRVDVANQRLVALQIILSSAGLQIQPNEWKNSVTISF